MLFNHDLLEELGFDFDREDRNALLYLSGLADSLFESSESLADWERRRIELIKEILDCIE